MYIFLDFQGTNTNQSSVNVITLQYHVPMNRRPHLSNLVYRRDEYTAELADIRTRCYADAKKTFKRTQVSKEVNLSAYVITSK